MRASAHQLADQSFTLQLAREKRERRSLTKVQRLVATTRCQVPNSREYNDAISSVAESTPKFLCIMFGVSDARRRRGETRNTCVSTLLPTCVSTLLASIMTLQRFLIISNLLVLFGPLAHLTSHSAFDAWISQRFCSAGTFVLDFSRWSWPTNLARTEKLVQRVWRHLRAVQSLSVFFMLFPDRSTSEI